MTRYGSYFAAGFLAGMVAIFLIGVFAGRDIRYMGSGRAPITEQDKTETRAGDTDTSMGPGEMNNARLSVGTQPAGSTVTVQEVSLDAAGWVVVHEIEGGHILNALGAARLDAGAKKNVSVELLRGTEPGREYAVVLYTDNGDKEFELRGDLPMIDAAGNPIMQTFRTFGGAAN